ncbi:pilus assembly protein [Undibacterium sp. Di27W]|uniref:pilus assembly protein n=1 Tax=Undibacterium sp. Di27W TaxID=3413036 RepID=UPI003BF1AF88
MIKSMQKSVSCTLICALIAQMGMSGYAYATISQVPPLVKPNVPPNIFYTLDDSGSMMFDMLPDNIAKTGNPTLDRYWNGSSYQATGTTFDNYCNGDTAPGADTSCWVTQTFPKPVDTYNVGGSGDYSKENQVIVGFGDNLTVARWRSSDVNKAYYNPKILYKPWVAAGGGSMDAANPAAALFNPVAPNGGSNTNTIDLTKNQTFSGTSYYFLKDDATGYDKNGRTFFPSLYYIYNISGRLDCTTSKFDCFTRVELKATNTIPNPKDPSRTDCLGSTCSVVEEQKNFANWFQYYRSRILSARGGSGQAFAKQNSTIRVGYGTINTTGTVINHVSDDFSDANKTAFLNTLYQQRMPQAGTPLRKALDEVGQYFRDTTNKGPWATKYGVGDTTTQLSCRQNYNILMTDGYWNGTGANSPRNGNVDGADGPEYTAPDGSKGKYKAVAPYSDSFSGTLADVATYYWANDLRPDFTGLKKNVPTTTADPAFWQHLTQFTVGLGVSGSLDPAVDIPALIAGTKTWPDGSVYQIDDLWHAAFNTRGKFFSASNPIQFAAALEDSLNTISERVGDAAAVGTSSNTVRAGSALYTSTYRTSDWSGQLIQKPLDLQGKITGTGWTGTAPAFPGRKIYTYVDLATKGKEFTFTNLAATDKLVFTNEAATYPPTKVTADNIVDYIKGGPDLGYLRPRTQTFGDFVNSAPLYVKEGDDGGYSFMPASAAGKDLYNSFLITKNTRTAMVYIGGNDGMLHAFNAATGVEAFAYVPKAAMSNLPTLSRTTYGHRFFVDGTPTVGDFYDGAWKTALVGTMAAGGRAVFALDVTNPDSFGETKVMWEINSSNDTDLGYTFGNAEIGRMPNGDWVAVMGNGYESTSGRAKLFIIRLKDGAITKVDTGVGDLTTPNGLSAPRILMGNDTTIKAIYAGDLQGNLWKFDVASSGTTVAYSGKPLFQAKLSNVVQPITVQPDLIPHDKGGMMVLFGTGKIYETDDPLNTKVQSLYGVWDNTGVQSVTSSAITTSQSALQKQTLSWSGTSFYAVDNQKVDWNTKRGWYMDLNLSIGERLTIDPQIFFDEVIFTTIIPASAADTCSSDGKSTTFYLDPWTGNTLSYRAFDTNGDKVIDATDAIVGGRQGGLTFGTTILKKGGGAVIYQPASKVQNCDLNPDACKGDDRPVEGSPTRRIWKQLLKPLE